MASPAPNQPSKDTSAHDLYELLLKLHAPNDSEYVQVLDNTITQEEKDHGIRDPTTALILAACQARAAEESKLANTKLFLDNLTIHRTALGLVAVAIPAVSTWINELPVKDIAISIGKAASAATLAGATGTAALNTVPGATLASTAANAATYLASFIPGAATLLYGFINTALGLTAMLAPMIGFLVVRRILSLSALSETEYANAMWNEKNTGWLSHLEDVDVKQVWSQEEPHQHFAYKVVYNTQTHNPDEETYYIREPCTNTLYMPQIQKFLSKMGQLDLFDSTDLQRIGLTDTLWPRTIPITRVLAGVNPQKSQRSIWNALHDMLLHEQVVFGWTRATDTFTTPLSQTGNTWLTSPAATVQVTGQNPLQGQSVLEVLKCMYPKQLHVLASNGSDSEPSLWSYLYMLHFQGDSEQATTLATNQSCTALREALLERMIHKWYGYTYLLDTTNNVPAPPSPMQKPEYQIFLFQWWVTGLYAEKNPGSILPTSGEYEAAKTETLPAHTDIQKVTQLQALVRFMLRMPGVCVPFLKGVITPNPEGLFRIEPTSVAHNKDIDGKGTYARRTRTVWRICLVEQAPLNSSTLDSSQHAMYQDQLVLYHFLRQHPNQWIIRFSPTHGKYLEVMMLRQRSHCKTTTTPYLILRRVHMSNLVDLLTALHTAYNTNPNLTTIHQQEREFYYRLIGGAVKRNFPRVQGFADTDRDMYLPIVSGYPLLALHAALHLNPPEQQTFAEVSRFKPWESLLYYRVRLLDGWSKNEPTDAESQANQTIIASAAQTDEDRQKVKDARIHVAVQNALVHNIHSILYHRQVTEEKPWKNTQEWGVAYYDGVGDIVMGTERQWMQRPLVYSQPQWIHVLSLLGQYLCRSIRYNQVDKVEADTQTSMWSQWMQLCNRQDTSDRTLDRTTRQSRWKEITAAIQVESTNPRYNNGKESHVRQTSHIFQWLGMEHQMTLCLLGFKLVQGLDPVRRAVSWDTTLLYQDYQSSVILHLVHMVLNTAYWQSLYSLEEVEKYWLMHYPTSSTSTGICLCAVYLSAYQPLSLVHHGPNQESLVPRYHVDRETEHLSLHPGVTRNAPYTFYNTFDACCVIYSADSADEAHKKADYRGFFYRLLSEWYNHFKMVPLGHVMAFLAPSSVFDRKKSILEQVDAQGNGTGLPGNKRYEEVDLTKRLLFTHGRSAAAWTAANRHGDMQRYITYGKPPDAHTSNMTDFQNFVVAWYQPTTQVKPLTQSKHVYTTFFPHDKDVTQLVERKQEAYRYMMETPAIFHLYLQGDFWTRSRLASKKIDIIHPTEKCATYLGSRRDYYAFLYREAKLDRAHQYFPSSLPEKPSVYSNNAPADILREYLGLQMAVAIMKWLGSDVFHWYKNTEPRPRTLTLEHWYQTPHVYTKIRSLQLLSREFCQGIEPYEWTSQLWSTVQPPESSAMRRALLSMDCMYPGCWRVDMENDTTILIPSSEQIYQTPFFIDPVLRLYTIVTQGLGLWCMRIDSPLSRVHQIAKSQRNSTRTDSTNESEYPTDDTFTFFKSGESYGNNVYVQYAHQTYLAQVRRMCVPSIPFRSFTGITSLAYGSRPVRRAPVTGVEANAVNKYRNMRWIGPALVGLATAGVASAVVWVAGTTLGPVAAVGAGVVYTANNVYLYRKSVTANIEYMKDVWVHMPIPQTGQNQHLIYERMYAVTTMAGLSDYWDGLQKQYRALWKTIKTLPIQEPFSNTTKTSLYRILALGNIYILERKWAQAKILSQDTIEEEFGAKWVRRIVEALDRQHPRWNKDPEEKQQIESILRELGKQPWLTEHIRDHPLDWHFTHLMHKALEYDYTSKSNVSHTATDRLPYWHQVFIIWLILSPYYRFPFSSSLSTSTQPYYVLPYKALKVFYLTYDFRNRHIRLVFRSKGPSSQEEGRGESHPLDMERFRSLMSALGTANRAMDWAVLSEVYRFTREQYNTSQQRPIFLPLYHYYAGDKEDPVYTVDISHCVSGTWPVRELLPATTKLHVNDFWYRHSLTNQKNPNLSTEPCNFFHGPIPESLSTQEVALSLGVFIQPAEIARLGIFSYMVQSLRNERVCRSEVGTPRVTIDELWKARLDCLLGSGDNILLSPLQLIFLCAIVRKVLRKNFTPYGPIDRITLTRTLRGTLNTPANLELLYTALKKCLAVYFINRAAANTDNADKQIMDKPISEDTIEHLSMVWLHMKKFVPQYYNPSSQRGPANVMAAEIHVITDFLNLRGSHEIYQTFTGFMTIQLDDNHTEKRYIDELHFLTQVVVNATEPISLPLESFEMFMLSVFLLFFWNSDMEGLQNEVTAWAPH